MTLPATPLTPAGLPPAPGSTSRTDVFSLSTGCLTFTWPIDLGDANAEDVGAWFDMMKAKVSKVAAAAKTPPPPPPPPTGDSGSTPTPSQ